MSLSDCNDSHLLLQPLQIKEPLRHRFDLPCVSCRAASHPNSPQVQVLSDVVRCLPSGFPAWFPDDTISISCTRTPSLSRCIVSSRGARDAEKHSESFVFAYYFVPSYMYFSVILSHRHKYSFFQQVSDSRSTQVRLAFFPSFPVSS